MGKINKQMLINKGLKEPNGRSYCNYTQSYCKLWSIGNFDLKITSKCSLWVFETINGELIKVIKDEKTLDDFVVFAEPPIISTKPTFNGLKEVKIPSLEGFILRELHLIRTTIANAIKPITINKQN